MSWLQPQQSLSSSKIHPISQIHSFPHNFSDSSAILWNSALLLLQLTQFHLCLLHVRTNHRFDWDFLFFSDIAWGLAIPFFWEDAYKKCTNQWFKWRLISQLTIKTATIDWFYDLALVDKAGITYTVSLCYIFTIYFILADCDKFCQDRDQFQENEAQNRHFLLIIYWQINSLNCGFAHSVLS
jgi:hypothetical protein